MKKNVCLLGSTGSVGVQALSVCKDLNFKVCAIVADENIKLLEEQARMFNVPLVCVNNKKHYKKLKDSLSDTFSKVVAGKEGILKVCQTYCDLVLNAIVGISGFLPTVFALENKKNVALANKESLVVGGKLILELAKKNFCKILPVDSEHSAIFQCIGEENIKNVSKIFLTASGGPFFGKSRDFLKTVTVKDALKHPNWNMGKKITIDSATMMNKGLELIEAVNLFDINAKDIEIVVHRQSVLHSAVEFVDGSVLGQFGVPDMKLAIQYALTYPKRNFSNLEKFSFFKHPNLNFSKPDYETFPCLKHCKEAILKGGLFPTVVNSANEKAVELFLKENINFLDIEKAVEKALKIKHINNKLTIDSILETDIYVKKQVESFFN